jgi:hypothetical protein
VKSGVSNDPSAVTLERSLHGASIECESPNNQLYKFEGKWRGLVTDTGADLGVSVDNVLLRGSTLRNTGWCVFLFIFSSYGQFY